MSIRVERADSAQALRELYRFRYRVYAEEMHLDPPDADHQARELADAHDEFAISFVLIDQDEVVGSLRLILLEDVPEPVDLVEKFSLQPALNEFGPRAVCTTSRFMLDPRLRGGRVLLKLMEQTFAAADARGARLNYGDCSPHMLPFYEHLGYRRYTVAYNDTVYGYKLPILMLARDHEWFERMRSPLRRIVARYPDDARARAWFARHYGDYLDKVSAAFMPEDAYLDLLASLVGESVAHQSRLFAGIDPDRVGAFLREAGVIDIKAGDRIVRQGEWDNTLYVILDGAARVHRDEAPGRTIALLGGGDTFGEMGLVTDAPRTSNVTADTDCRCLVLSGGFIARFRRQHPGVAAQLLFNLSAILANRLAVTSAQLVHAG